eukprot:g932.t1
MKGGTVWRRVGETVGVGPKGNVGVNGVSTADAGADDDVEELQAGNKLDELVDVDAEERPVGNGPDEPVGVVAWGRCSASWYTRECSCRWWSCQSSS